MALRMDTEMVAWHAKRLPRERLGPRGTPMQEDAGIPCILVERGSLAPRKSVLPAQCPAALALATCCCETWPAWLPQDERTKLASAATSSSFRRSA